MNLSHSMLVELKRWSEYSVFVRAALPYSCVKRRA